MRLMDRAGGVAGLLGMALIFMFVALSEIHATPEDSSAVVAEALVANRGPARVAAYLGLLAAFLLIVFVSRLHGSLRSVAGSNSWFPTVTLIGGTLLINVLLIESGLQYAASELTSYGQDTQVARFFILWSWDSANLYAPAFAAMIAGSTLVAFVTDAYPRWFRWAGVVLLILIVLIVAVLRAPGLANAPGALWVALASVLLVVAPASEPAAT